MIFVMFSCPSSSIPAYLGHSIYLTYPAHLTYMTCLYWERARVARLILQALDIYAGHSGLRPHRYIQRRMTAIYDDEWEEAGKDEEGDVNLESMP